MDEKAAYVLAVDHEAMNASVCPPVDWRRFEDVAPNDAQRQELQTLLEEKGLSRHDLALILLSLRVRPEFSLEDFDT